MAIKDKARKKIITVIKCLSFLVLMLVLLGRYTKIMMNKNELFCSATLKEYENHSIDVLFLGGSQMVYAAQPMILWEQYGIRSYNMATSATTIPGNYWSARIAFETQKPKVVMLDCTLVYMETKTFGELPRIHAAIDAFWPSYTVYQAINDLVEDPDKRLEFYWTPYIYHTRWKDLSEADFVEISDYGTGGAWLINHMVNFDDTVYRCSKDVLQDVPQINLKYIEKLIQLCQENDSELVLTVLPIPMCVAYQPIYNTLERWAEERDIPFINGYDDPEFLKLDYGTDFTDVAHMNIHGIQKSSVYIGDYLISHYDLDIYIDDEISAFFDAHLEEYKHFKESVWTYPLLTYGNAITFSIDGNQEQFYGGTGGSDRELDPSGIYTWTTGRRSDFYFYIEDPSDAILQINLQAVQPIMEKETRTVDVYVNEKYVASAEMKAEMNLCSFSIDINKDLWMAGSEEQKITFKYPDISDTVFEAMPQNYTLGLKEIYLERK